MVKVCTRGRSRAPSLVSLSLGTGLAWSWSISLAWFMRGAFHLSVGECEAASNPIFLCMY
ncbi:hypothetical protein QJS04_geneDACA022989 [Acorus gramineus]|uniref:Uncharacterized protein n=1 Tax=Acorus gramineus TaxID=55184 RepID=A0AAV9BMH0_ACOGR|nr:hypothetical protein QJS04_geneDACA022989 [Acorus gramineus]